MEGLSDRIQRIYFAVQKGSILAAMDFPTWYKISFLPDHEHACN
jgi:hypothetical protein